MCYGTRRASGVNMVKIFSIDTIIRRVLLTIIKNDIVKNKYQ